MAEIIPIDGPASSGKSTIGKLFASEINYQFIDAGIFYRAGCVGVLTRGGLSEKEEYNGEIVQSAILSLTFSQERGVHRTYIFGEDISSLLHSPRVDSIVPILASQRTIREIIKNVQKEMVKKENTVMTGRSIGSDLFPDAPLKYYITASDEIRALRRHNQLVQNGSNITFTEVLDEIRNRDFQDSTRSLSPLKIPERAHIIDTSDLTIPQAVQRMRDIQKLAS